MRLSALLSDAIVVLAFHPLVCHVDDRAMPAQFVIRSFG